MRRLASATAGAVLAATALSGCGGGGGGDIDGWRDEWQRWIETNVYCDALQDADKNEDVKEISATDPDSIDAALKILEDVATKAPSEVKDDWGVFVQALEATASGDTGDVDVETVRQSLTNIDRNAKDECDLDLNLS